MHTAPPTRQPHSTSALRRAIAGIVALSIIASLLGVFVVSAANAAASNSFSFRDGSTSKVFGPN